MNYVAPSSIRMLVLGHQEPVLGELVQRLRLSGFTPSWQLAQDQGGFLAALEQPIDLIVSDHAWPGYGALEALTDLQAGGKDVPFIVVSDCASLDAAVSCMRNGAADYLSRDDLSRLESAVTRALVEREQRRDRRQSEADRERLLELSQDLFCVVGIDGYFKWTCPAFLRILGWGAEELLANPCVDFLHPEE